MALVDADGSISAADKGATSLEPDDPIRIASITQAFTAALVLTLVDDGLAALDTSASVYVPRLSLPEEITVRYLLNQRSGLADYTQAAIYGNTEDGNSTAWTPDERSSPRFPVNEGGPSHHVEQAIGECLKNGVSACWPDMLTRFFWVGRKERGDE